MSNLTSAVDNPAKRRLDGIRVCVFDAYGTLFDVHSMTRYAKSQAVPQADRLSALWREKQLQYTWLRSLQGKYADFWRVTQDALEFALASLAITAPGLQDRLMQSYLELDVFSEAAGVLSNLKGSGVSLGILSNGTASMLNAVLSNSKIGNAFEHVISVEEVNIYKPHPSVYALACSRFQRPLSEIAFVSSNGWHSADATALELRTI